eukprot:2009170-Amphidinium_carterae.1
MGRLNGRLVVATAIEVLIGCCACAAVGYCTAIAARAMSSPLLLLASRFPVGMVFPVCMLQMFDGYP